MPEYKVCKPPADWDPELVRRGERARPSMPTIFAGAGAPVNTARQMTARP